MEYAIIWYNLSHDIPIVDGQIWLNQPWNQPSTTKQITRFHQTTILGMITIIPLDNRD